MNRRIDVQPLAELDAIHYFLFIGIDDERAAHRFLGAVVQTYKRIATRPGIGRPREIANPTLRGVRSIAVDGFPNHLIFYRVPDDESVRIVRIRHAAMDHDAISMEDAEQRRAERAPLGPRTRPIRGSYARWSAARGTRSE